MKSIPPLVAGAILLACSAVASAQATLYGRENFRGRAIVVEAMLRVTAWGVARLFRRPVVTPSPDAAR